MILTLEQVLEEVRLSRVELTGWIEQRWILPAQEEGAYVFSEVDVARIRLICELRRDMQIDEEAIPVVLSLLDQVYALRHALSQLNNAINTASEQTRTEIAEHLKGQSED